MASLADQPPSGDSSWRKALVRGAAGPRGSDGRRSAPSSLLVDAGRPWWGRLVGARRARERGRRDDRQRQGRGRGRSRGDRGAAEIVRAARVARRPLVTTKSLARRAAMGRRTLTIGMLLRRIGQSRKRSPLLSSRTGPGENVAGWRRTRRRAVRRSSRRKQELLARAAASSLRGVTIRGVDASGAVLRGVDLTRRSSRGVPCAASISRRVAAAGTSRRYRVRPGAPRKADFFEASLVETTWAGRSSPAPTSRRRTSRRPTSMAPRSRAPSSSTSTSPRRC